MQTFRKTLDIDIPIVTGAYAEAIAFLKESGVDQWQNNYPNEESLKQDIKDGYSYVLLGDATFDAQNTIMATVAVSFDLETDYDTIHDGAWLTSGDYVTLHRIAVLNRYKGRGVFAILIKNIGLMCKLKGIHSMRIDTHEDNKAMQRALEKSGFVYCGIIFLKDGAKRLAYEKTM